MLLRSFVCLMRFIEYLLTSPQAGLISYNYLMLKRVLIDLLFYTHPFLTRDSLKNNANFKALLGDSKAMVRRSLDKVSNAHFLALFRIL